MNVSTPGTDQAIDLAKHPAKAGALHHGDDTTKAGKLAEALPMQDKMAVMYALTKGEYPARTKAMWGIMARPMAGETQSSRCCVPNRSM